MDVSLILFSVAMFFQPVDMHTVSAHAEQHCQYLGVQYPVGQKIMVSTKGQIFHKECKTYKADDNLRLAAHWVEKHHQ
ncbi:hypothetical protein TDB9533_02695 [Thalassocella blandensis]|nr:hypothetical protein TDB9533_02695 [Thalassocella blandensis]